MKEIKETNINVRLSKSLKKQLLKLSDKKKMSASNYIRNLIKNKAA